MCACSEISEKPKVAPKATTLKEVISRQQTQMLHRSVEFSKDWFDVHVAGVSSKTNRQNVPMPHHATVFDRCQAKAKAKAKVGWRVADAVAEDDNACAFVIEGQDSGFAIATSQARRKTPALH